MTREQTKYCEECKYCQRIAEVYKSDFDISCQKIYYRFNEPIVYCKYKKLKKENKKC